MPLQFPVFPKPSYSFEESFIHKTLVSQFECGAQQRRNKWSQGRRIFTLKNNAMTKEESERVWEFYQLCKGSFKEFIFINPSDPTLPHESVTVYLPLHEGEGTKTDDWNGFIRPSYFCHFMEDNLAREEFSYRLINSQLKIYQVSPVIFTNNYGAISGASWAECPDGTACLNFDGTDDQTSCGNAADLNVGTFDFSFAFGLYANSLAAQIGVLSKKANNVAAEAGYHLVVGTNGQITVRLSNGTTQNVITSSTGAIPSQTWRIVVVTFARSGNGQIYVNNVSSGSPVALTAGNADNTRSFFMGRAEGVAYGNCRLRNFLFARKVWTQAERDKIYNSWRGLFQI